MPTQTDVQQLIQGLGPSGVNNGNPNTAYNQPRQSTPPPTIGADGQWYLNTINPAANQAPQQLGWNAWNAPANSLQQTKVQWPVMQQPPTPAPGGSTPVPTTPVPMPTTPVPVTPASPTGDGMNTGGQNTASDPTGYYNSMENGCVAIDQEIYGFISPEAIEVGDIMPTVNPHTFEMGEHEVSYSETKVMPCVIITTHSGAELKCSTTAPLLLPDGKPELAGNLKLGDRIAVQIDGMFDHSEITNIEDVGHFSVQHITCGNQYFLAGNGNGKYILHHNMKMVPGTGQNFLAMYDARDRAYGGIAGDIGGAEAAGNHSMFGNTGYRNDNMSAGQYSQNGNGWFENSPAGQPLGQGIIDAFGATDNPLDMYNKVSESLGNSAAPISGNAWGNLTGGNVSSWNPNMSNMPTLPAVQSIAQAALVGQEGGGSFWDTIKHGASTVADWIMPGNNYHSDTKEWAPWQYVVTNGISAAFGADALGSQIFGMRGGAGLKDGYDPSNSTERTAVWQMNYAYQNASPENKAQILQGLQKDGYAPEVINAITSAPSPQAWQNP